MIKMSKTRAFLLELCSAGIAIGSGLLLLKFGIPIFIVAPIVIIIAWFQMGFFINIWKDVNKNGKM